MSETYSNEDPQYDHSPQKINSPGRRQETQPETDQSRSVSIMEHSYGSEHGVSATDESSKSLAEHSDQGRDPASIADIKATGNLIYKHIVCMIDFLILKYRELKNPQRDPVVFKKFIFFKQDVITQTAQLISQLEEFQDIQLWLIAQDFIFTTYDLHQYLIQLVIDKQKLSTETTIELQRALTILYKQSIIFIRALDVVEAQSYIQPDAWDPNMPIQTNMPIES